MWALSENQLGLLISALLDQPLLDFHHKPLLASPVSLERPHQLDPKRRPGQNRWGSLWRIEGLEFPSPKSLEN